jgi:hypothetical protein
MTNEKSRNMSDKERDLEQLLIRSFDSLRTSPAGRERFSALDRMLSRIEARERHLAAGFASPFTWSRWVIAPLTAAAAGFAGAALALLVVGSSQEQVPTQIAARAPQPQSVAAADDGLDRSIQRLENAVRGLEKFQPLLESRIEWVEDTVQRHVKDAFAADDAALPDGRAQPVAHARRDNGV